VRDPDDAAEKIRDGQDACHFYRIPWLIPLIRTDFRSRSFAVSEALLPQLQE